MLRLTKVSVVVSLAVAATAQQPEAVFDAPIVELPSDSPPFQALFDYDGDGDMDAVGGRVKSDGTAYDVRVWRNQQGRYVQVFADLQNAVGGAGTIMAIAVGDLDHDSDADFVVGTGLAFYRYTNGNGTWTRTVTSTSNKVGALGAADFDGDGWTDVAVFTKDPTTPLVAGQLQVRLAAGPVLTTTAPANVELYAHIITFDSDGNGTRELGLWYETRSELHVFAVAGASLTLLQTFAAQGAQPSSRSYWAEGDVDGDQDVDIVAFEWLPSPATARLHCFRNNGAGVFTPEAPYHGGPARFLRDVDGDGDLDGVCCGGGGGGPATWPMLDWGSTYVIALNDGQGHLAPSFQMAGLASYWMAGVTDVDGDGRPDIVAGRAVYYGRGTLTEGVNPAAAALDPSMVFGVRKLADQLGDFDRDGDLDFVSTLELQGCNDGSGAFQLRPTAFASALPAGFTAGHPRFRGDFDGDGAADFVVPLFAAGVFSHMELVRNNGSGVLTAAGPAAPPGVRIGWLIYASSTDKSGFTADLDGDGDVDLVANADSGYETTYHSEIWWNQGNGTFVAGPTFATERIEAVADFDSDGRQDLLTRIYAGPVQIRLGTAAASAPFGPPLTGLPPQQYSIDAGAFRVVDANDDGRPDILARTSLPSIDVRHGIFCNTTTMAGTATFQESVGLLPAANSSLGAVLFADVDNDGRSDLIQQSPLGMNFVTRISRRLSGDGQVLHALHYAPPIDQVIWDGFPADADADGDVDLIGNRVARNMLRHGTVAGSRRQYGEGSPGEAGIVPLLGVGPTVLAGGVTNLHLSGVTGPTVAVLAISLQPASLPQVPLPGLTCLVDPATAVTGTWTLSAQGAGAARGAATLPVFLPQGLQGFAVFSQVFVLDPAAQSWLAASNGLLTRFGG